MTKIEKLSCVERMRWVCGTWQYRMLRRNEKKMISHGTIKTTINETYCSAQRSYKMIVNKQTDFKENMLIYHPDSKVHVANMGPTWVLSSPGGLHVSPMNLDIRACIHLAGNILNYLSSFPFYNNGITKIQINVLTIRDTIIIQWL